MASKSTKPSKTSDSGPTTTTTPTAPAASTTPTTPAAPDAPAASAAPTAKKAATPPVADAPAGAPVAVSGEAPTNVGATSTSTSTSETTVVPRPVYDHELQLLAEGRHGNPHAVLGAHPHEGAVTVRVFKPLANSVTVLYADGAETLRAELHHE